MTHTPEVLEEILELVRSQQRLLNSPDMLLPSEYVENVFRKVRPDLERDHPVYADLAKAWGSLIEIFQVLTRRRHMSPEMDIIIKHLKHLEKPVEYILRRHGHKVPHFDFRRWLMFDDSEAQPEDPGDNQ